MRVSLVRLSEYFTEMSAREYKFEYQQSKMAISALVMKENPLQELT